MRWIVLAMVTLTTLPAAGQELGVTAEVERPMAGTGGDDPTASATEIEARERPRTLDSLEDALREAPGARPLSTGAYGSPTILSLRGSDAQQVEVLFGDVPLTTADGSAFDLSSVPLWALERVEVYRGGAPTWLGVGGIGGVLRLVPREARGTSVEGAVSGQSFGLMHGRLGASVEDDDVRWMATVGGTSSEGDFLLVDDGRTAFDPSDDVERPRRNAHLRAGSGLAHLSVPLLGGRLSAVGFGLARTGGVPGPASQPTRETRRHEAHLLGGLAWERTEGQRRADEADWRVALGTSVGFRRRRFRDRLGEIGLSIPSNTVDDSLRVVARSALSGRPLDWLELTAVGQYTHGELWPSDSLAPIAPDGSTRDAGTLGIEARFFGRIDGIRLELRPSARLGVVGSRLSEIRPERIAESTDSLEVAPTGRIGAAIEPVPGLTISASAATATRTPSMVELFGDRGFVLGDTRLSPERAETFDLGIAMRGREGPVRGSAELRGFATLASDLIRYVRDSRFTARPENIDSALLAGGELGVRGSITRHFAFSGALTLLGTWTEHLGATRQLPLRPSLTGYLRPEVRAFELGPLDRLSAFAELAAVTESFWDPANQASIPGRARFGLGVSASVWEGRIQLDASVDDVLDARGTDQLGFPLPGRSFAMGLRVRTQ